MKKFSGKIFAGLYLLGVVLFVWWWNSHPNPKSEFDINALPIVLWGIYAPIAYIYYRLIDERKAFRKSPLLSWGEIYLIGAIVASVLAFANAASNPGDSYAGMNIVIVIFWLIIFPILSAIWFSGKFFYKKFSKDSDEARENDHLI